MNPLIPIAGLVGLVVIAKNYRSSPPRNVRGELTSEQRTELDKRGANLQVTIPQQSGVDPTPFALQMTSAPFGSIIDKNATSATQYANALFTAGYASALEENAADSMLQGGTGPYTLYAIPKAQLAAWLAQNPGRVVWKAP